MLSVIVKPLPHWSDYSDFNNLDSYMYIQVLPIYLSLGATGLFRSVMVIRLNRRITFGKLLRDGRLYQAVCFCSFISYLIVLMHAEGGVLQV